MMAARVGEQSAVELKFVYRKPLAAIRSRVGVGITPPNVLVTPKPVSSVLIKKMFGPSWGGTTGGGQQGVGCAGLRSILPSNLWGGGGQLVSRDCRCRAGRARRSGSFLSVGCGGRSGGKKGKRHGE